MSPNLDTAPTPRAPSLLRLHVLLPGTVRRGSETSPLQHLHQGHWAHARAAQGGDRAGRGPAIPHACCQEQSDVRLGRGGVRPCVRRRGHQTPLQPSPPSLSPFGPGHGLAGRLPREHGAPHEDFGRAPRSDKRVGDEDASVTAARGHRGGGGGRVAAGTAARARRQLRGRLRAGWEASTPAALGASLKPPAHRLSAHLPLRPPARAQREALPRPPAARPRCAPAVC